MNRYGSPLRPSIRLTQLDCDISLEFIFESDSLHPWDSFHHCTLAVSHMANGAHIDSGLPADYNGGQGRQLTDILQRKEFIFV